MHTRPTLKTIFAGALVALLPLTEAQAQDNREKEVVSLARYFELQEEHGMTETHMRYTIFQNNTVPVSIPSAKHGDLNIPFNARVMIPRWTDKNGDGRIDVDADNPQNNELHLMPTIAMIASTHAALGRYNAADDPAAMRAMALLAHVPELATFENLAKAKASTDHLENAHGIVLFNFNDVQAGQAIPRPADASLQIIKACLKAVEKQQEPAAAPAPAP